MVGYFHPHVMYRGYAKPPHNSLVENSAVPIFLVPPQMLSECLLSLIPQTSRMTHNRQNGRKETQPSTCDSCGTVHQACFQCPAANRRCYSCRRYGHYAQFCRSSSNSTSPQDNKHDHVKKATDLSVVTRSDAEKLCNSEVKDLEAQLLKCKEENVHLQKSCAALRAQNDDLSRKVKDFATTSGELEQQKCMLEGQLKQVFMQAARLINSMSEYEHLASHLVDEFESMADCCQDPDWGSIDPCSDCGARLHDGPEGSCLAQEWKCIRCDKTGHFAAVCESDEYPNVNFSPEIIELFGTLAEVYGIELQPKINCVCEFDEDYSDNEPS